MDDDDRTYEEMFQFHNGSIKRDLQTARNDVYRLFQFHNGSIKRRRNYPNDAQDSMFQFHNGSIKSPNNQQKNIIQNPRYFYKEKTVIRCKSRQRPVVQNPRRVDDSAWLRFKSIIMVQKGTLMD